jgi:lipopolysaccharide export system permease protein
LKTLHAYLTRQVLASLLLTVATFTFVLLIGNVLKELIELKLSPGVVAEAIGLLIPFVAAFGLPMGMLTATLLIFGRFSADQELTAARASGISLLTLVSPILLLSLALCGVSALVNMEIAPRCRVAYNTLLDHVRLEMLNAELPEGRFIKDFPNYIIYVGHVRRDALQDVMIYYFENGTNLIMTARAARGTVERDLPNHKLVLTLFQAKSLHFPDGLPGTTDVVIELDIGSGRKRALRSPISDMSFGQLQAELRDLERLTRVPVSLANLSPDELRVRKKQFEKQRTDLTCPVRFQLHRQVAFSFACFGFTLVGIPLGIRVHRRETNVSIAIALVLAIVYYSFIPVANSLDSRPEYAPHLIVWLPNFLFQAVGAVLLWRANRGV